MENPPWSGLDLLTIVLVLLVALFFFSLLFGLLALHAGHKTVSTSDLGKTASPQVIVPAMTCAYLAMLGAMYTVARRYRRPFWQTVGWNWPRTKIGWLCLGVVLSIGLGLLSRLLPIPKSMPMDRFFRDAQGAYLMAFFGVTVAPLAEEMLFRGFLYPVLDRWLQSLFSVRQQMQSLGSWVALLGAWGFVEHRLPFFWSALLAVAALVGITAWLFVRGLTLSNASNPFSLLPGISFFVWGLVVRTFSDNASVIVAGILLGLGLLLSAFGLARNLASGPGLGRILAITITAAAFAMVHSEQLGRAWAPLLVLFVVGLVLTITRAVTRSVAPGFLIHVGYNLTLFLLLYSLTDHFRHLERITE